MRPPKPSQICMRERETYELIATHLDTLPSSPPAAPPPSSALLAFFFIKLPQELRDMIYTYLIPYTHTPFIIQPPLLFLSDTPSHSKPLTPYSPLAFLLPLKPSPLLHAFLHDTATRVLAPFFATNIFWTRYRYTRALYDFLTNPFEGSMCVPAQHVRRLKLLLAPPESCEDDWGLRDVEAEFEWGDMWPQARSGRCAMWREQLEGDFGVLGELFARKGCEVGVFIMEGYGRGDAAGVEAWVRGWAEGMKERGGRVEVSRCSWL